MITINLITTRFLIIIVIIFIIMAMIIIIMIVIISFIIVIIVTVVIMALNSSVHFTTNVPWLEIFILQVNFSFLCSIYPLLVLT